MMSDYSPGDLLEVDYRQPNKEPCPSKNFRIVQWNIERNYELDRILSCLDEYNADILCIQEIDISCTRSGCQNGLEVIAKHLKMKGVFVVEFIELDDETRSEKDQGGNGLHGNAIFSKNDITNVHRIIHKFQPVLWDTDGFLFKQPRRGNRVTLRADISMENITITCYSAHLEVFCNMVDRLLILSEILEDSSNCSSQYQVLAGDMNTLVGGFARFSEKYCSGRTWWSTIGTCEAEIWSDLILCNSRESIEYNKEAENFIKSNLDAKDIEQLGNDLNSSCSSLTNPYFIEPFSLRDVTFISHGGFFKSKLDWIMVRSLNVENKFLGNNDFKASDHKSLIIDCVPETSLEAWKQKAKKYDGIQKPSLVERLFYLFQW